MSFYFLDLQCNNINTLPFRSVYQSQGLSWRENERTVYCLKCIESHSILEGEGGGGGGGGHLGLF